MNIQSFESLLHRLFAAVCLDIDLYDADGKRVIPREWFVVPLNVINEAVELFINGGIVNYKFDINKNELIPK